jgi:cell shape-determining protein MreC
MTDFETMPIGTKERLRELEEKSDLEFYNFMESDEEKNLWSGNYNNASRDEFVAKRAWEHQQKKIKELEKENQKLKKMIDLGLGWEDMKDE